MSFRDLGKKDIGSKPLMPIPIPSSQENSESESVKQKQSAEWAIGQIADALKDHNRGLNFRKEESLIRQSTTVQRYDAPTRMSAFSKLNDEIVHFQKMVNDLRKVVDVDVMTPEEQWRVRILLKTAAEVDIDVATKIRESPWNKQRDLTVKASFSKLKRDYERVHRLYEAIVHRYHTKQRAEAALLVSKMEESINRPQMLRKSSSARGSVGSEPAHGLSVLSRSSSAMNTVNRVAQEEDFFDRAMRAREEEEVKEVNTKLHTVNDIYSELGKLVSNQQESVDVIEDQIRLARAGAEVGYERIQQSRTRMFGFQSQLDPQQQMIGTSMCGMLPELSPREVRDGPEQAPSPPPTNLFVPEEEQFHWTLPFRTFGTDISEVRKDLVDLGYMGAEKLKKLKKVEVFRCGAAHQCTSDRDLMIDLSHDSSM